MKKFKFALLAFMTALISFAFTACSDDDEVKDVPVTAVTVSPTTLALKTGTTGTLTATVAPENATVTTVSWTSSDDKIATVDKGVVTAVAEGTATITVKRMMVLLLPLALSRCPAMLLLSTKASIISTCS